MDYQTQPTNTQNGQGFGIASMVLGIVSLVLCCCVPIISIICSIISIIFGVKVKGYSGDRAVSGMATAGIVCSIISLILCVIWIILSFTMTSWADKLI